MSMIVQEAGRLGGRAGGRKGGKVTKERYGPEYYRRIGRKGGRRVKELIEAGRESLGQPKEPRRKSRAKSG